MTLAVYTATVARLRQLAVWANARLSVHAPEQTIVARRHRVVVFGIDEKALPTKRGAQVWMSGVEALTLGFRDHVAPFHWPACKSGTGRPAAVSSARFTATAASFTL